MLTILRDIHYANVFMVGTQEDTCEENEVWKFGIPKLKLYFENMQLPQIYVWSYAMLLKRSELINHNMEFGNIDHKIENKVGNSEKQKKDI